VAGKISEPILTEKATDLVRAHEYLRQLFWVLKVDTPYGESFSVEPI
jgi:hypothetical protein